MSHNPDRRGRGLVKIPTEVWIAVAVVAAALVVFVLISPALNRGAHITFSPT